MTQTIHRSDIDRSIFKLAFPVLGTLIAEPLLTAADSAMIGHVGTTELAGLTAGAAIINFVVGMCIFVQYTTTSITGKKLGKGDKAGALHLSIQAVWMSAFLGIVIGALLWSTSRLSTSIIGATGSIQTQGMIYIHWSTPGIIFMLIFLAATGAMRGLLDTNTPFIISTIGAFINIPLNAIFIYGFSMGVAGAGLGTSISTIIMTIAVVIILQKNAHQHHISIRPQPRDIVSSGLKGAPLVIRSLSLQLGVMTTVWLAIRMGEAVVGAHQIVRSIYLFAVFGMDALAMAAQSLIANAIGQGNRKQVRAVMSRCIYWGVISGGVLAIIIAAISPFIAYAFTTDPAVLDIAWMGLITMSLCLPLAGAVFMYDGILIGAGDMRYLAFAQIIVPVIYIPAAAGLQLLVHGGGKGLVILWLGYGFIFMGVRLATMLWRARGDQWIIKAEQNA